MSETYSGPQAQLHPPDNITSITDNITNKSPHHTDPLPARRLR